MGTKKNNKKKRAKKSRALPNDDSAALPVYDDIDFDIDGDGNDENDDPPPSFDVLDSVNDIEESALKNPPEKEVKNEIPEATKDIMSRYGISSTTEPTVKTSTSQSLGSQQEGRSEGVMDTTSLQTEPPSHQVGDMNTDQAPISVPVDTTASGSHDSVAGTIGNGGVGNAESTSNTEAAAVVESDAKVIRDGEGDTCDAKNDHQSDMNEDNIDAMLARELEAEEKEEKKEKEKENHHSESKVDASRRGSAEAVTGALSDDNGDAECGFFFDHSWMAGHRNKELLQEAEVIICQHLLEDSSQFRAGYSLWRDVLGVTPDEPLRRPAPSGDGERRLVGLSDFLETWKCRSGDSLPGRLVSALLVRCGDPYESLRAAVKSILSCARGSERGGEGGQLSAADGDMQLDKALNSYNAKTLSAATASATATLDPSSTIDLDDLKAVLLLYESLLCVWTVQMSRIQPYIDEKDKAKLTAESPSRGLSKPQRKPQRSTQHGSLLVDGCPADPEELFVLATRRLGMPALSRTQVVLFAKLVLSGESVDMSGGVCGENAGRRKGRKPTGPLKTGSDDGLAELMMRCSEQCRAMSPLLRYKAHLDSLISFSERPASHMDDDMGKMTGGDVLGDDFGGGGECVCPASVLSVFGRGGSSKNTAMDTKRLCDYLVDSYVPEVSASFLSCCCYLWSAGNFAVFVDEDGELDADDMFHLRKEKQVGGSRRSTVLAAEIVLRSCRGLAHRVQPSDKSTSVILQDTLVKFFYPFNISLKQRSVLGTSYFKHKFHPLENTHQLFNILTSKFFLKFRQSFSAEKAPADLRIYKCSPEGDKKVEIVRPSEGDPGAILADVCGEDDYIFLGSERVALLCEQRDKARQLKKKQQQKGGSGDTAPEVASETRPPPTNAKELVSRLAHPPTVHVLPAKPFPFSYGTAHAWGINTMVKYLDQVMELPQYEEHFLQFELNGYSFLCLDKAAAARVCAATDHRAKKEERVEGKVNPESGLADKHVGLHVAKLVTHSENLRKQAYQHALDHLPVVLEEFHPIHIASLLHSPTTSGAGGEGANSPLCAMLALRKQLSGQRIITLQPEGIASLFVSFDCDGEQISRSIQVLLDLLKTHTKNKTLSVAVADEADIAKKHIHISTFDKKADRAEEKRINAVAVAAAAAAASIESGSGSDVKSNKKKETSMAKKRRKQLEERDTQREKECSGPEDKSRDVDIAGVTALVEKAEDDLRAFRVAQRGVEGRAGRQQGLVRASVEDGDEVNRSRAALEKEKVLVDNEEKRQGERGGAAGNKLLVEQTELFSQQMASMQEVLLSHTELVSSLKKQNEMLVRDREEDERRDREKERQHEVSMQAVLTQRDLTAQHLSLVTGQYVADLQCQIEQQKQKQQQPHTVASNPLGPSTAIDLPPVFQEDPPQYPDQRPHSTHGHAVPQPSLSHRPSSPSQLEQMRALHVLPVRAAQDTFSSRSTGQDTATPDIVAQMDKDAEYEIHQWKKLLKVYSLSRAPLDIGAYDDVDATIRRLAVVWCRLGRMMYDDVVGRGGDVDGDVDGGGGGTGSSLEKLLGGLLAAARRAVDTALEEGAEDPSHNPSGGSGRRKASSVKDDQATLRQLQRAEGRRKKQTQGLLQKMSSSVRVDAALTHSLDPKRYCIFIGLVFALAVVYKLVNKFDKKCDQVNLMFLLQRLREGDDTCFKELSRDDLRGFLSDHLCVEFDKKWHKFDSLCQRLDPDKRGFVSHSQVHRQFRWSCPLAEPLSDGLDGQVAVQVLLSMVSIQALLHGLELNSLFKKILIDYKDIVPSFQHFVDQKAVFPAHPPHDARMLSDASLIADFLFVLASQYLGWSCERSSFNISYHNDRSWKLPDFLGPSPFKASSLSSTLTSLMSDNQVLFGAKFSVLNLRGVCDSVSKSLLLYDYSSLSNGPHSGSSGFVAFAGLSTLLSTYLAFWRQCAALVPPPLAPAADEEGGLERHTAVTSVMTSDRRFTTGMTTLLGGDSNKVLELMQQVEDMGMGNVEVLVSELMGAPVLTHLVSLPLVTVQAHLAAQLIALQGHLSSPPPPAAATAAATAPSLPRPPLNHNSHGSAPSPPKLARWDTKSAHRLAMSSQGNAPIISERDDCGSDDRPPRREGHSLQAASQQLQLQHRLKQVSLYAKELQHKLDSRKAILKGLLHLLRSMQGSKRSRSTTQQQGGLKEAAVKFNNLQKRLLSEMQEKRSTRVELLEKHVNDMRKLHLTTESSPHRVDAQDEGNDLLGAGLREVSEIEGSILQANADSLLIIDNISGVLNCGKK